MGALIHLTGRPSLWQHLEAWQGQALHVSRLIQPPALQEFVWSEVQRAAAEPARPSQSAILGLKSNCDCL